MEKTTFITSYLHDLWQETQKGHFSMLFFNTYDNRSFAAYLDQFLPTLQPNFILLRRSLTEQPYSSPYFPFLDFLKDYFQNQSGDEIDQLLTDAGVYPLQRPVFSSYFQTGQTQRPEELILEELDYEKNQMLEAIFKLFCHISQTNPLVIVVENLHYAHNSTIDFIHNLVQKNSPHKMLFIFSTNKSCLHLSEIDRVLEELKDRGGLIDFPTDCKLPHLPTKEPTPITLTFEEMIQLGQTCLDFLAFSECQAVLEHVYQNSLLRDEESPYDLTMYRILGDVLNFSGENDLALTYYNTWLRLAQQSNDQRQIADAFRKIGLIYLKKNDSETAERYANQSLKIAEEINDSLQIFRAYFLLYMIIDKARNRNQHIKKWLKTYKKLIGLAHKLNKQNTLAYCCTNPYGTYCQQGTEEINLYNYGISLAKKLNNKYRLATAYQFTGLMFSIRGEYDRVLKYYKKCEKLKLQLGNKLELAYIYNGLGFYYFMTENFLKAYTYYNKALACLTTVRDNHEIGMTLCNIAFNAYAGFNHEFSNRYLNMVIKLLHTLQMKGLRYHSLCMIYSLMGINYYKLGDIFKAKECMLRIVSMQLKPYPKNNEEYALFYFFCALLYKSNKEYDSAEKYFRKALSTLERRNYIVKYLAPRFYYEFGLMAREQQQHEKAIQLYQAGLKLCDEMNFPFHAKLLHQAINLENPPIKAI